MERTQSSWERNFVLIALLMIMLLAAALRFYRIETAHLHFDEVLTVSLARMETGALAERLQGGRPPVQIIMLHLWMQVFGTSDFATRAFSAVVGILSIPFVYLIGNRLFGRQVGLVSALVMAVAYIHIYHSQEVRYYSVLALMVLIAAHFYIRALDTGRWQDFAWLTIFSILAIYTHYYAGLAVAAWGLHFILYFNKHRKLVLPWLISQVLILVPSLLIVGVQYITREELRGEALAWTSEVTFSPDLPFRTILRFMVFGGPFAQTFERAAVIGALILLVAAFALWKRSTWVASVKALPGKFGSLLTDERSKLLLVVLWLVVPIAVMALLGNKLAYRDRYVLGAAPALYILVAVVIVRLQHVVPIVFSVGAMMAVMFFGLGEYYAQEYPQMREAANYVEEFANPDDAIYVPVIQRIFYWYYPGNEAHCFINNAIDFNGVAQTTGVAEWDPETGFEPALGCNRIWLVLGPDPETPSVDHLFKDKIPQLLDRLVENGYTQVDIDVEPLNHVAILLFEHQRAVTDAG